MIDEPLIIDLRCRPRRNRLKSRDRRKRLAVLIEAQGNLCAHCERPFNPSKRYPSPWAPTIEHVQAISQGGGNGIDNLLAKHKCCNEAGGNRPPSPRDRKWQAIVAAYLSDRQEAA